MTQPIVIAHHLIWTAYGWWLPNDPRGSGSKLIRQDVISELGELHYGRKVVQPTSTEIRVFQSRAAEALAHSRLTFHELEMQVVAEAFAEVLHEHRYTCYQCAIMPDHVHILLRKHKHQAEDMIENLRTHSRLRLSDHGLRTSNHPTWTSGAGWKVFLDDPSEVHRTIDYIANNPIEIGAPPQHWPFVTPYNNWPLHPGHSPNSPYVKRLKAVGRYP